MRALIEKVFGPVEMFSQYGNVSRWRVGGLNYHVEDVTEDVLRELKSSRPR